MLFEENEKICPEMKEKAFLSMLNQNFPREACPRNQVTRPKGSACNYPLGFTPVTTTAMAVQNSFENPASL